MANPNLNQLKPLGAKAKRDKESIKIEEGGSVVESYYYEEDS